MTTASAIDPTYVTTLLGDIDELEQKLERVSAERDALAARLTAAEREIIDIRDGYRHTIYTLRGNIVGALTGRMTRMLQTSLDAAREFKSAATTERETFRANVIIERVEDVMTMLAKFVQAERNPEA